MTDGDQSSKLAKIAFEESLRRQRQQAAAALLGASDSSIEELIGRFEEAAHQDEEGGQYWFARDLQRLLEYAKWDNFLAVVAKAKEACTRSGHLVEDHFADVGKMVALGSGAEREVDDIVLSRYAAYLIAQNGDPRKQPIAFAQTYFAIQTRRQEVEDSSDGEYVPLSEDERRVLLRDEIKEHNRYLASAAKNAGVREGIEYAIFQTEGYKGLYGGLDVPGIRRRKGLSPRQHILDHMGSTELAANLFRATQTEEKLRRDKVQGKEAANRTHFEVGRKVRQTIEEIGGVMPERLPPAEDIKKVSRRLNKALKNTSKRLID
jgi:DNA-damage-inducible protein D